MTDAGRPLLLLDTNIWLDYYMADRRRHDAAFALVDALLSHEIDPLFAVTSIKDVFYLVQLGFNRAARSSLEPEEALSESQLLAARECAWSCASHMQKIAFAVGLDASDIACAMRQKNIHPDLEDDLVIAAMVCSRADLLVTNDDKLLRHCPVAALDARDALSWLRDRF